MTTANWALQKALYQVLSTDTVLAPLVGNRIFDDAPVSDPPTMHPFLVIGEGSLRDWSTSTEDGAEHIIDIRVYSRSGGRSETKLILEAVDTALRGAAPNITGHVLINLTMQRQEVRMASDGETHLGLIRFRVVTEPE